MTLLKKRFMILKNLKKNLKKFRLPDEDNRERFLGLDEIDELFNKTAIYGQCLSAS